jgi:hypothetical protein
MPVVRFAWDAQLVDLRREVCPRARWDKASRAWVMTAAEAGAFLKVVQTRKHFSRMQCTVTVDETTWLLGFAEGTPYRLR